MREQRTLELLRLLVDASIEHVVVGGVAAIVGLDDLIAIKEHVARPKDLLVAGQLKAVRARMRHPAASEDDGGTE